jgi:hypothetical protein
MRTTKANNPLCRTVHNSAPSQTRPPAVTLVPCPRSPRPTSLADTPSGERGHAPGARQRQNPPTRPKARQTTPNDAKALQTPPSRTPAQNEPTQATACKATRRRKTNPPAKPARSLSPLFSVPPCLSVLCVVRKPRATRRNTAQQFSPPAQNEPTPNNGSLTMDDGQSPIPLTPPPPNPYISPREPLPSTYYGGRTIGRRLPGDRPTYAFFPPSTVKFRASIPR